MSASEGLGAGDLDGRRRPGGWSVREELGHGRMSTTAGLVREVREERERELWCGSCALWQLASGRGEASEGERAGDVRGGPR